MTVPKEMLERVAKWMANWAYEFVDGLDVEWADMKQGTRDDAMLAADELLRVIASPPRSVEGEG